ncbi:MAG: NADAR family protein [Synergistaceae bacterium]|nr:NADAR family protein [Synergistaceae bacterium]
MDVIARFREEYEFLSNLYEVPVTFRGLTYGSSEAAYQAWKSLDPADHERFTQLRSHESKTEGRKLKVRKDWDEVKVSIMDEILRAKFSQNPELLEKLLATGHALIVEGNHWKDTFWGFDTNLGYGQNMLGQLLMRIRAGYQGKLLKRDSPAKTSSEGA